MSLDKLIVLVEKELNSRKVYQDAADALKTLKGLSNLEKEIKQATEKARVEKEEAVKELEAVKKQVADGLKKVKDATDKASTIVEAARLNGKAIVEDAVVEAKAKVEVLTAKEAAVQVDVDNAVKILVELNAEIVEKQTLSDKLEAEVAKTRKKLSDLLG